MRHADVFANVVNTMERDLDTDKKSIIELIENYDMYDLVVYLTMHTNPNDDAKTLDYICFIISNLAPSGEGQLTDGVVEEIYALGDRIMSNTQLLERAGKRENSQSYVGSRSTHALFTPPVGWTQCMEEMDAYRQSGPINKLLIEECKLNIDKIIRITNHLYNLYILKGKKLDYTVPMYRYFSANLSRRRTRNRPKIEDLPFVFPMHRLYLSMEDEHISKTEVDAYISLFSLPAKTQDNDIFCIYESSESSSMHPIIKNKQNIIVPNLKTLMHSMYPKVKKIVTESNKKSKAKDKFYKIRGTKLENDTKTALSTVFDSQKMYTSVLYPIVGQKDAKAELDMLIVHDRTLIFVECKSSPLFDVGGNRRIEKVNMDRSIKDAIKDAYDQLERCNLYVRDNDTLNFEYREGKSKKSLELDKKKYDNMVFLNITRDDFYNFSIKKEFLINKEHMPFLSYNINDMRIICKILDKPWQIIHFLTRRYAFDKYERILVPDEINLLGLYLDDNMYPPIGYEKANMTMLSGYDEDIFKHMFFPQDFKKPTQSVLDARVVQMFDDLCSLGGSNYGYTRLTNLFLEADGETRKKMADNMCVGNRTNVILFPQFITPIWKGIASHIRYLSVTSEVIKEWDYGYTIAYCSHGDLDIVRRLKETTEASQRKHRVTKWTSILLTPHATEGRYSVTHHEYMEKPYIKNQGAKGNNRNKLCACGSKLKSKKCPCHRKG